MHNNWLWRPSQRSEEDENTETFEYGSRDFAFEASLCLDGADLVDAMVPADVMSMTWRIVTLGAVNSCD